MARTDQIHLPTVRPGISPGGIWIRLCTKDQLITEHALDSLPTSGLHGTDDGDLTCAELENGRDCWLYIYDGDTGECVGTFISYARKPTTKSSVA